jgi:flagellar protein FlaJ
MKFKFRYTFEALVIGAGLVILLISNIFVAGIIPFIVPILNLIGGVMVVIPPSLLIYNKYKIRRESEKNFLAFLLDLANSIDSGMTLPQALQQCSKRRYAYLSRLVNKLAAQVDWGIPFDKALNNFAKKTYSPAIGRAVTTINETYKAGGKISDTLSSVTNSMMIMNKIQDERKSSVYSQTIMIYVIFFVFIAILVLIEVMVIPSIPSISISGFASSGGAISDVVIKEMLTLLIVVQGFFAGMVTGKMAEGSIKAGLKHSLLLVIIGYGIFSMATQISIPVSVLF